MRSRLRTANYARSAFVGLALLLVAGSAQTNRPAPQMLLLNLRLRGFEPATATATAGRMLLVIHNQTGKPTLNYLIASTQGQAVTAQGLTQTNLQSRATVPNSTMLLNLTAGTYTVVEASQPKWTFTLTVK